MSLFLEIPGSANVPHSSTMDAKTGKISGLPQLDFVTITLITLLSLKNMKQQIVSQGGETNFSNPNLQYV